MNPILAKLTGGNRRSIGKANEVVSEVLSEPSLFDFLFDGLLDDDPIIRMRSADAIEKITADHNEYLQPYKKILIGRVAMSSQKELRWHVAQMIPRLNLTKGERARVVKMLMDYLTDQSHIVKTFAMQALADIATRDDSFRTQIIPVLVRLTRTGSPAMKSRGRKLLVKLRQQNGWE
jgi:hypothetical protein